MASVTNLRFAQLAKAVLGLKAVDPQQNTSGLLSATFDVQDPYRPEGRLSRGEFAFSSALTVQNTSGGVGFQQVNIVNPVGSGRMCVLQDFRLSGALPGASQTGRMFLIGQRLLGGGAVVSTFPPTDMRVPSSQVCSTGIATFTNTTAIAVPAANPVQHELVPGTAGTQLDLTVPVDIILPPGQGFIVWLGASVLPTTTYVYMFRVRGYERTAEAAEIAGVYPP